MPRVTIEQIGAKYAINHYLAEARRHKLLDIPPYESYSLVYEVSKKLGITIQDLKAYGFLAMRIGCTFSESKQELTYNPEPVLGQTEGYSAIRENSVLQEGTVWRSSQDSSLRYRSGPSWHNNSCALDVLLWLAVQLDYARLQVDQLDHLHFRQLKRPAQVLYDMMRSGPWGDMTQSDRNELRDILREQLHNYNKEHSMKNLLAIDALADIMFDGLPQASWTEVRAQTCCDGILRHDTDESWARQMTVLHLSERMVKSSYLYDAISHHFARKEELVSKIECSKGSACLLKPISWACILDRPPYTLICHLAQPTPRDNARKQKFFIPFEMNYYGIDGPKNVTYDPIGCVVATQPDGNHFYACWVKDATMAKYRTFDSMKNAGTSTTERFSGVSDGIQPDLGSPILPEHYIAMMIYRQRGPFKEAARVVWEMSKNDS